MSQSSMFDIEVHDDIDRLRSSTEVVDPFDWFSRLWAVAVVAHIIGNPRVGQLYEPATVLGWTTVFTGLIAVVLVVKPHKRMWFRFMCGGVLAMVWLEAPFIGNHWLLAGFVSAAALIALSLNDSWNWFATTGRGIHLAFYVFAAFAKVNSAFLDPAVSCSTFYANESLGAVGLPGVSGWVGYLLVYLTVGVEFLIPVLLLVPRTRNIGVAVGLVFHTLVSFDLDQHFYDFTAVLIPLFLLWTSGAVTHRLGRSFRRNDSLLIAGMLAGYVVVSVLPLTAVTLSLLTDAVFVIWIPASIWLVALVGKHLVGSTTVSTAPFHPLMGLLVGLVILNGLTPYFEIKTGTSWNMYSNLYTAGGESNHLIVRRTLPLTDALVGPFTIVSSDDPDLSQYVGSGYALPKRTMFDYLAEHPSATATVEQTGQILEVGASQASPLDPFTDRFGLLRAIDLESPTRCQPVWLPAR